MVPWFGWIVPVAVFVLSLRTWLKALNEARTAEDVPTTRIRSAPQGYVELQGVARALDEGPLTSPMLGAPCVWWKYTIRHPGGKSVEQEAVHEVRTSSKRFYIEDATGRCLIDPAQAEIVPNWTRSWRAQNPGPPDPHGSALRKVFACSESVLLAGTRLYVRGEFRTVRAAAQPLDLMRDKLQAMTADAKKRAILDVDRDGALSETELEAARRVALGEARREAGTTHDTADVVCKPLDGRPFVITNRHQDAHASVNRWLAIVGVCGMIFSGAWLLRLLLLAT